MNRRSTFLATSAVVALVASMVMASAASATATAASGSAGHRLASADSRAHRLGSLPADPAAYARAKAALDARYAGRPWSVNIPQVVTPPCPTVGSPNCLVSAQGLDQITSGPAATPAIATSALGSDRAVEFINGFAGVYNRDGTLAASGSLRALTGISGDTLYDPQVIWDPSSGRFFFAMNDNSATKKNIAWGFSKTSTPATATTADWCTYSSSFTMFGTQGLADGIKLGQTADFVLIGTNVYDFAGTTYQGSRAAWTTKPPAGPLTTCPSRTSFFQGTGGKFLNLADRSLAWSPVPANQVDGSSTGYLVELRTVGDGSSSDFLTTVRVTKKFDTSGNPMPQFGGKQTITVPSFTMPPDAAQAGSSLLLDTGDGRLSNAVSSKDPRFLDSTGKPLVAIWTQQTVAGGAGSEVRWYEIDPLNGVLLQSGTVNDPTLSVYNGAISSDRAGNGGKAAKFGSNMVLGVNTSSASADTAVQMVSKVGAGAQSGMVLLQQSPGPNEDSTCATTCPWGFAEASPDPNPVTGATQGHVWLSSPWNQASPDATGIDWLTWQWDANP